MTASSGTQEVAVASTPVNLTVGDLDGDGTLDLATVNANGSVSVRLNAQRVLATKPRSVVNNLLCTLIPLQQPCMQPVSLLVARCRCTMQ